MKRLFYLFCATLISGCVFGQAEIGVPHEWTTTIKVVDGNGQPVEGANVSVSYSLTLAESAQKGRDWDEIKGLTDKNGAFSASHSDRSWDLGINVQKAGCYPTHIGYELYVPGQFDEKTVVENRNPKLTLVLKKIGKPIPMYARWVDSEPSAFKKTGQPPISFDKSIGYDLMAGDWVAPYGKGQTTDIIFTEEFNKQSITDFYYKLTISFPNVGDGIQEYIVPDAEKGSALRSSQEAPADGYQPQLIKENYHHPGQTGKPYDYDENRIYFFRTTLSDGPHYGKIYGDFMQFRYYLNPTPNDRNIEFNSKENLLKGNPREPRVMAP